MPQCSVSEILHRYGQNLALFKRGDPLPKPVRMSEVTIKDGIKGLRLFMIRELRDKSIFIGGLP